MKNLTVKHLTNWVILITDNLTDSNAIDHQLPSLNNSTDFLIDTVTLTKAIRNKNMIPETKNFYTRISPNNGNDSKDYLCDSEYRSSVQIEQSSTWIDIEEILERIICRVWQQTGE